MSLKTNLHATAIVIGTRGVLFLGSSGSGKSSLALRCLEAARLAGQFSALIADDQVFIENGNGKVIARRPAATAGMIEVRHSGIARIDSIEAAILHLAVLVVDHDAADRLPPDGETYTLPFGLQLPLLRMVSDVSAPLSAIAGLGHDLIH